MSTDRPHDQGSAHLPQERQREHLTLYEHLEWRLTIEYRAHVDIFYTLLSQIINPDDAARIPTSLHHPLPGLSPLTSESRSRLMIDYYADPRRLTLHALPLITQDLDGLTAHLSSDTQLTEPLRTGLLTALSDDRVLMRSSLDQLKSEFNHACRSPALSKLLRDLQRCRRALHSEMPPPLRLIHTPALGRAGRGCIEAGTQLIATSFLSPHEHLFCQLLHEETHSVTDHQVLKRMHSQGHSQGSFDELTFIALHRETRPNRGDASIHHALEEAAVSRSTQVISGVCPHRRAADLIWRQGLNIPSGDLYDNLGRDVTEDAQTLSEVLFNMQSRVIIASAYLLALSLPWLCTMLEFPWGGVALSALALALNMSLATAPFAKKWRAVVEWEKTSEFARFLISLSLTLMIWVHLSIALKTLS